jgi:hypothetical protein
VAATPKAEISGVPLSLASSSFLGCPLRLDASSVVLHAREGGTFPRPLGIALHSVSLTATSLCLAMAEAVVVAIAPVLAVAASTRSVLVSMLAFGSRRTIGFMSGCGHHFAIARSASSLRFVPTAFSGLRARRQSRTRPTMEVRYPIPCPVHVTVAGSCASSIVDAARPNGGAASAIQSAKAFDFDLKFKPGNASSWT